MKRVKANLHLIILGIVLVVACIGGYIYWQHELMYPSTDDAYVNANVINISSQVTGPATKIYVQNYQFVTAGQPLLDIDPAPFQLAVDKANAALHLAYQNVAAQQAAVKAAEAAVAQRRNELLLAQQNANRTLPLVRTGEVAKTEGDAITEKLNVAHSAVDAAIQNLKQAQQQLGTPGENNANIRNAEATLAQAQLDLAHTHITAPNDGRLINFDLQVGNMLTQGVQVFSIIEQKEWWVDANFKETDLRRIRVGQEAVIYVDIYPNHPFKGVVEDISQGSGSAFSLLPAENATGNWVKVTQRFPVKVRFEAPDANFPLRVGASAMVTVDTAGLQVDNSPAGSVIRNDNAIHQ